MAAKKQDEPKARLTQDLTLPPGVVLTPDYEVVENQNRSGYSDRRIFADGSIQDFTAAVPEHLSTYDLKASGAEPIKGDAPSTATFGPDSVNGPVSPQA